MANLPAPPPPALAGSEDSARTDTSFTISWNSVQNATSYSVRLTSPQGSATIDNVTTPLLLQSPQPFGAILPDTRYDVELRYAVNAAVSDFSSPFTTFTKLKTPQKAPQIFDDAIQAFCNIRWDFSNEYGPTSNVELQAGANIPTLTTVCKTPLSDSWTDHAMFSNGQKKYYRLRITRAEPSLPSGTNTSEHGPVISHVKTIFANLVHSQPSTSSALRQFYRKQIWR